MGIHERKAGGDWIIMCGDGKYYSRLWKKQAAERKELEKEKPLDSADDPKYWEQIITKPLKNDPDFWTTEHQFSFRFSTLNLMTLHGFLCLALRHPGVQDHLCRPAIEQLVKQIGQVLVDLGALTSEQLTQIEKTEAF